MTYLLKNCSFLPNCVIRITIVAHCDMDLRLYPMDTQHCSLRIESCKYDNLFLDYFRISSQVLSDVILRNGRKRYLLLSRQFQSVPILVMYGTSRTNFKWLLQRNSIAKNFFVLVFVFNFTTDAHTVADVDYKWKTGKSNGVEIVSSKMAQFDLLRVETINDASTNSKGNKAGNINDNAKWFFTKLIDCSERQPF